MPGSVHIHFSPMSHGKAASFAPPSGEGGSTGAFSGLLLGLLPKERSAARPLLDDVAAPAAVAKVSDAPVDQPEVRKEGAIPPPAATSAPTTDITSQDKASGHGGIGKHSPHPMETRTDTKFVEDPSAVVTTVSNSVPMPDMVQNNIQTDPPMPASARGFAIVGLPSTKDENVQRGAESHRSVPDTQSNGTMARAEQSTAAAVLTDSSAIDARPERATIIGEVASDAVALTTQSAAYQPVAPGVGTSSPRRVEQVQAAPSTVQAAPIDQVVPAVVKILGTPDGTQSVAVRLQPSELGQVQIRVDRTNEGMAHVSIMAERPETLQMLQHDEPRLQQALDQAGVPSNGRIVTFQATPPDQVGPSASRPDSMEAGAGGSGQGQSGGAWRESSDGQQSSGNGPGSDERQARSRWYRAGLDITA